MTPEEVATGLLANLARINAIRILDMAQAMSIAQSGEIPEDLLRLSGATTNEIGRLQMAKHKADLLAESKRGTT